MYADPLLVPALAPDLLIVLVGSAASLLLLTSPSVRTAFSGLPFSLHTFVLALLIPAFPL